MLERIEAVLPACLDNDVRIVTNMGAANPRGGARAIRRLARDMGAGDVSCAVVTGDDVSDLVRTMPALKLLETGAPLESILPRMASANAYLGADVVAKALATGARIVITGRVSDPSLFLAPALHEFGWSYDDWPQTGRGPRCRPSPRVLRAGQRRLLRRSRKEGGPGPGHARLSLRRHRRRRQRHHRQARHQRRAGGRRDLHRAAALRDPRSRELHHAGLRGRHHRTSGSSRWRRIASR